MKNRFASLSGTIVLMFMLVMTGCADPCKDVECNNGTCVDGGCICDPGYQGVNCDTRQTAKFVATYNVAETCNTGNFTYTMTITESTTETSKIWIKNLYDVNSQSITDDVTATVTATGIAFDIPSQTIGTADFTGSGTIDENTNIVTIDYMLDGGATDECIATCTPQ